MTVLCYHLNNPDPYFNLATEEYLLKNYEEDIFMLWSSESSIVVGKHQNALAEINHRYVKKNKIKVARRLSGGGTVFHDPGNLNFTFMKKVEKIEEVNYKLFLAPVKAALEKLGLEIGSSKRDDLLIDGKKISGNAQHVFRKRVLHHGTLLFDSHLAKLKSALKVDLSRFEDKAVQSNRSVVTNIADYLKKPMTVEAFRNFMFETISTSFEGCQFAELTEEDKAAIQILRDEKYCQWEWIYGYSPKYIYRNTINIDGGELKVTLRIVKGKIDQSEWEGPLSDELKFKLTELLRGKNHAHETLKPALKMLQPNLEQEGLKPKELLRGLL
ncbi:lipoate--protein ligase family protein [Mangrovibacterium diazotrophicum]|uniref:lipoate--protein ligase n=1 Tax=Mangrovibacterium diazotrophicum TaxID=1261403 RepID=A0A419W9S0_9BACT|nr:lipoate--protein ligase [Mangrovibacterium diazotrophicum]RKD92218.1 lipoate-protein ligase A [Mangrovibacterium diazotrophicum]